MSATALFACVGILICHYKECVVHDKDEFPSRLIFISTEK